MEDLNDNTPSVFTVATNFFSKHKADCDLYHLSNEDFDQLVRLSLTSDTVLIGNKPYKQRSGLAMGNNLAPVLATIYMNELDNEILVRSNGCVILKRFMNDYFAFLTSKELTSKRLLETANGINDVIKVTLEVPNNNQLPFLDTLVTFNSQNKTFSTTLYMKPIHSRCTCITPWECHGSVACKRAILVGETKRAIRCSTDSESQKLSLKLIKQLFIDNGYPNRFVKRVIRNTLFERRQKCENQEEFLYLKLPFIIILMRNIKEEPFQS